MHLAHVVDAADVRVRNAARVAHLGQQPLARFRVAFQGGGEELQRDRLVEPQVVGAVHLAHAAAAEQRDDAVAGGEHAPWRKADDVRRDG